MEKSTVKTIKLDDYELGPTLGIGAFSRVKFAKRKKDGKFCAVKVVTKIEIIRLKQTDHALSEIEILAMIDHPFVVALYGFAQDECFIYLFLELVNGGDLLTRLRKVGKLAVDDAKLYIAQVISIFEHLHSKHIVYRDLKPENLLIDRTGFLELTDFGFAKVSDKRTYTICGTPEYLAPEIILNKGHSKPVDWWTLGILLYEMLVGVTPFADDDPMMVYQNVLKGRIRFPSGFDSSARSLIKHLIEEDITKRYGNLKGGVNDIKNHKLFKNINWVKLVSKGYKAPFIPEVKSEEDISNFDEYPEPDKLPPKVGKQGDPFLDWFK